MSANLSDSRSLRHQWARWLVEAHKLSVFPVPPGSKSPKPGGLGIRSATADLAAIDAWWLADPNANVGVCGCLRIDVDTKNGGVEAWKALEAKHGAVQTLTVRTPRGGLHKFFRTPQHYGNSTGALPPGIDVRGHSTGYTLGPGSVTVAAADGTAAAGCYALVDPKAPIAEAPAWLLELIGKPAVDTETHTPVLHVIDEQQHADLRAALLSPGMLADWGLWSDNGLALLSLGDVGRGLWEEYSTAQLEYCDRALGADDAEKWWARHSGTRPKSDYRTIFKRARERGWANPIHTVDPARIGFGKSALPAGASTTPIGATRAEAAVTRPRVTPIIEWVRSNPGGADWIVKGLLPNGVALLLGAPGAGKSFVGLDLAVHVVLGRAWYGHRTRHGRAVWVAAEAAGSVTNRVRAAAVGLGVDLSALTGLSVVDGVQLGDARNVDDLMRELEPGIALTVIDTLAAASPGLKENTDEMQIAIDAARRIHRKTGGTVLLIHHHGKDPTKGARGWSGITGAADAILGVERSDNVLVGTRTITVVKQRDGEDGLTLGFELASVPLGPDADGDPVYSLRVIQTDAPTRRARLGPVESVLVDMVKRGIVHRDDLLTRVTSILPPPEPPKRDQRSRDARRAFENLVVKGVLRVGATGTLEVA
jgi:hypothetical protein